MSQRAFIPLLILALLTTRSAPGRAAQDAAVCSVAQGDPQRLAEIGLKIYRDAQHLGDPGARTRALEQALRCFLLCMEASRGGAAKINHPLGLVYEKLGRNVDAVVALRRFLREVPETQRLPGVTKQIDDKLASLRPRVAELSIDTVAGLEIRVDRQLVGRAPLDELLVVTPGTHDVTVGDPSVGTLGTEVQVTGGQVRRVELTGWRPRAGASAPTATAAPALKLTPEPEPASARPAARPLYRRWWLWTAVGAAVVGGTTAALLATRPWDNGVPGDVPLAYPRF